MKQRRPPSHLVSNSAPGSPRSAPARLARQGEPQARELHLQRARRLGHGPGTYSLSGAGAVQRVETDSEDSVKLVVRGVAATSSDNVEAMKFGGGPSEVDEKRLRELLYFVVLQSEDHFGTGRFTDVSLEFEDFGPAVGSYIFGTGEIVGPLLDQNIEGAKAGQDKQKFQALWKQEHQKEVQLYTAYLTEIKKLGLAGVKQVADLVKVVDSMHLSMNIVNDIMIEWEQEPKVTTLAKSGSLVVTFTAGQEWGLDWVPPDACYIWNVVKIGKTGDLKTFLGEIAFLFLGKKGNVDIYMEAEPWVAEIYKTRFGAQELKTN